MIAIHTKLHRAVTPKFELGTYPQVSSSCVYSFRSYCVDKHIHEHTNPHTDKQIPLKTSNVLHYATTMGNKFYFTCNQALERDRERERD